MLLGEPVLLPATREANAVVVSAIEEWDMEPVHEAVTPLVTTDAPAMMTDALAMTTKAPAAVPAFPVVTLVFRYECGKRCEYRNRAPAPSKDDAESIEQANVASATQKSEGKTGPVTEKKPGGQAPAADKTGGQGPTEHPHPSLL